MLSSLLKKLGVKFNRAFFLINLLVFRKPKKMLTLKLLREQPEFVIERLAVKHFDAKEIVYQIIDLDKTRRSLQGELDACLSQQKTAASEIGKLMKEGRREEAEAAKAEVGRLKDRSRSLEEQMAESEKKQNDLLVLLPNLPCAQVPEGRTADDNVVVKLVGDIPDLGENPLPHWELVKNLDIIDFDLGVKLTGAGFPVYKGKGARIQRALISWFLEKNTDAGYLEYQPPYMVNEASGFGTGQLPDKEGQMYCAPLDGFYMIPTAEVPVTRHGLPRQRKSMQYVDANVFLRFILDDDREMADYAEELLAKHQAFALPEVIAEIIYVLMKVYKVSRTEIVNQVNSLLEYADTYNPDVMRYALSMFAETSLDFVDCELIAYNHVRNAEIATFDKALKKHLR